jgi:hypothetical protein
MNSTEVESNNANIIEYKQPVFSKQKARVYLYISLLVIFVGVPSFSLIFRSYRLELAQQQLITALKQNNIEAQEKSLQSYKANLKMGASLNSLINPFGIEESNNKSIAIDSLYGVITKISLNDFSNASLLFRDSVRPNINAILLALPLTEYDRLIFKKVVQKAENWLENVEKLSKIEIEAPEILSENKKQIAQQTLLATELFSSFSQLLGFEAITELEEREVSFYENGVLAGLPKLQKIPDNIADLKALKSELDKQGVSVTVSGSNVYEAFNKKINELRNSSLLFKDKFFELTKTKKNIIKDRNLLRLAVYQDARSVKSDLIQLLAIITENNG